MQSDLLQKTIEIQKKASDPNNSAWVFASAGSGKTKVLIDRLLRILMDGVLGNKILCVTFTKVAALEMQERVNAVLQRWTIVDEGDLRSELETLLDEKISRDRVDFARSLYFKSFDEVNNIKIVTIHSLCQDILRIFPFEAGVNPNFKIMDQMQERKILQDAKNEIFRISFADDVLQEAILQINSQVSQDEFLSLIANFLSHKERFFKLKDLLGSVDNVFEKVLQNLGLNFEIFSRDNLSIFKKSFDVGKIIEIVAEIRQSSKISITDKKFLEFFGDFNKLDDEDFVLYSKELFLTKNGDPKKRILTKKFECWQSFAEGLQDIFIEFFDLHNSIQVAKLTDFVIRIVDKILMRYQEVKFSNGYLDYSDLIIKAQNLLRNDQYKDWVRYRLDGFFDHILIDESQDTNDSQWSVIEAISEEFFTTGSEKNRSIFVIGDEKQSIFSFQGADPNISYKKFDYFKNLSEDYGKPILYLSLDSSFRSLSKVLSFVDDVFEENSSFIKMKYNSHKAIRGGEGVVEVWPRFFDEKKSDEINLIDFKGAFIDGFDSDGPDKHKLNLAKFIAAKIQGWVDSKRLICKRSSGDKLLPVDYSDIMIVARNQTNGFTDILKSVFIKNDIPFSGDRKIRINDNLILLDLVSILRFSLLPDDDLNLAALLKSPFFDMDEERLFEICQIKNELKISIFQAICLCAKNYAKCNDIDFDKEMLEFNQDILGVDALKVDGFYLKLFLNLLEVIDVYRDSNLSQFYFRIFNKEVRSAFCKEFSLKEVEIIDEFLVLVNNLYSQGGIAGEEFVAYLNNNDVVINLDQSSDNSVKITTIHSAKGLQSPIVIIPDCCYSFNKMPSIKNNLVWLKRSDDFYGNYELPIWLARKKNSGRILDIEIENRSKMLKNEYLRLFYVALTRAENEIYISGFGNDNDKDSWFNIAVNTIKKNYE